MLLGAVIGWGLLSPLAKHKKWAPGPVSDWQTGSKGWIVWVSLGIMLADVLVSLAWLVLRPALGFVHSRGLLIYDRVRKGKWKESQTVLNPSRSTQRQSEDNDATESSTPLLGHQRPRALSEGSENHDPTLLTRKGKENGNDSAATHVISNRWFITWILISVVVYLVSIQIAFPFLVPFHLTFFALVLAFILSILGVRALGETDLNPVSGISKLTQLVFAAIVPSSNPNAVTINLLAGAISESGAVQAGDLCQDLKTGHLLGAEPSAQFWGQIWGSVFGAAACAFVYKLYTHAYTIGEGQFQVPTGYVWIYTARLVTGKGLPPLAGRFAFGAAALFALLTALRIAGQGRSCVNYIPGGVAAAVGMYNTPDFTFARAIGGTLAWYWIQKKGRDETNIVVLASGLILGEGLLSICNLLLAYFDVPHL